MPKQNRNRKSYIEIKSVFESDFDAVSKQNQHVKREMQPKKQGRAATYGPSKTMYNMPTIYVYVALGNTDPPEQQA